MNSRKKLNHRTNLSPQHETGAIAAAYQTIGIEPQKAIQYTKTVHNGGRRVEKPGYKNEIIKASAIPYVKRIYDESVIAKNEGLISHHRKYSEEQQPKKT